AQWRATLNRLTSFHEAIEAARAEATGGAGIQRATGATALALKAVTINLPDGQTLLGHLNATIKPGEHTLLTGPSGIGKSTLFRALAGIWPFGDGAVEVPASARVMFLPQRPYLPIGPLRNAVAYPASERGYPDAEISEALRDCGLPQLATRLDESDHWGQRLSIGEQQRLAFARALLYQPDWLFLDEATSALDETMEKRLYTLLRERLPSTTLVSIAHRPSVAAFHSRHLSLIPDVTGTRLVSQGA
ncbi:MAG: ATP-binding cassette domain-containing protein, partial [Gammaproteobacteria bacterium]